LHTRTAARLRCAQRTTRQPHKGCAIGVVFNLNILPTDTATYPCAQRLGDSFLGGKTLGQQASRLFTARVFLMFLTSENPLHKPFAQPRQHFFDSVYLQNISAYG
jgi:hypothetical protein